MKRITAVYTRPLSIYLVAALIAASTIAGPAEAMFLPAASQFRITQPFDRADDLARIQRALESETLQQRLMDYGLSPGKTMEKVNGLSDEQVHQLAAHLDALQAGGMSSDKLIIILLLVVLILILVKSENAVRAG